MSEDNIVTTQPIDTSGKNYLIWVDEHDVIHHEEVQDIRFEVRR